MNRKSTKRPINAEHSNVPSTFSLLTVLVLSLILMIRSKFPKCWANEPCSNIPSTVISSLSRAWVNSTDDGANKNVNFIMSVQVHGSCKSHRSTRFQSSLVSVSCRYPALRCFLERHQYPLGTMNLRKFSWSLAFFKPADTYKIETITPIILAYPARKYICVGDSGWFRDDTLSLSHTSLLRCLGELDPEIYSKLYALYPTNISHIFIRDICSTPECLLVCQERYRKIFEDVPKSRWTVFKDPKEIETNIEKLIHG